MKNKIINLALSCIIIFNTSCATIINGSKKNISIKTEPSTAKIYVDDEMIGNGNANILLKRKRNHIIMIKNEGYQTRYIEVNKHGQAGFIILDVLFMFSLVGVISIITDGATGSWNTFDKDNYNVVLEKEAK